MANVVQTKTGFWASGNTVALTFSSPVTSGNTIVLYISGVGAVAVTISSVVVTGTGSGTFTSQVNATGANNRATGALWTAPNVTGGTFTITVTFSATLTAGFIAAHEVAGLPATITLNGTPASNSVTAATIPTAPISTSGAAIIFAGFQPHSGASITSGAGGSWTDTLSGVVADGADSYQIFLSSQTSLVASAIQNGSSNASSVVLGLGFPYTPPAPPPTPSNLVPVSEGSPGSMQLRVALDLIFARNPAAQLKDWNGNTFSLRSIRRTLNSWELDNAKTQVAQNPPAALNGKLIEAYVQFFPVAQQVWLVQGGSLTQLLYTVVYV